MWGGCSVLFWGVLIKANLWPGWLAFSAVVLMAAMLLGWAATGVFGESSLETLLKVLTAVILGVVAAAVLWLVFAEMGVGFGMELAAAFRFSGVVCLIVAFVCGFLAVARRLPGSLPSLVSLELAVFTFGATTNGLIGIGLNLLKPMLHVPAGPYRFLCFLIGIGVTYFLTSRGFFVDQTRCTLRFGAVWFPAIAGSVVAASVALHLVFAVQLRTLAADERVVLSVNNGLALFTIFIVLWIVVFGRRRVVVSWGCMAVSIFASIYLAAETRADRNDLEGASELARKASFSFRSQDYEDALRRWQEVLDVRERTLPGSHELVGEALGGVGNTLFALGRPDEAIAPLSHALGIVESSGSSSRVEATHLRAKIALSLLRLGRVGEANSMLSTIDVTDLLEFPKSDFDTGAMLSSVADGYRKTGRFDDAEQMYRRSLQAIETAEMRDYDAIFEAKSGLARVLMATGRYEDARTLIDELRLLMSHKYRPLYMSELYLLEAEIDAMLERFSSAASLQKQALQLLVKQHGRDHPDTAIALRDLGTYLIGKRDLNGALAAAKNAREILVESLGPDSPEVVKADYVLACVYQAAHKPREAAALLQNCIERWQEIFGDDFVLLAEARHLLAGALVETGDHRAASDLLGMSLESALNHFQNSLSTLSDQQQLAALRRLEQRYSEFMIHAVDHLPNDPELVVRCFDWWLRIKGVLLDVERARGELSTRLGSAEAVEIGDRLRGVERQLASLWLEGRIEEEGGDDVASLKKEKRNLEKRLNSLLAESGFWVSDTFVTSSVLESLLPAGSSYVDYCWARSGVYPDRFLAFVLPAVGHPGPFLVDLGPAEPINRAVSEYLEHIAADEMSSSGWATLRRRLFELIVRPLLPYLDASQTLLISPDGVLGRLPFAALVEPSGEFLDSRFQISYLSSGRDITLWGKPFQRKRSAIIFADPNFDSVPAVIEPVGDDAGRSRRARRVSWRLPPLRNVYFQRLAGTLAEANGIATLLESKTSLDVLMFTDLNANEQAMAFVESPWLMHFATHGFFLPPDQLVPAGNLPASMIFLGLGGLQADAADNPLSRAGLALAGANVALREGDERGLLTLDEVMAMPLGDTEMVVVSACESGVGEIEQGEGVFGVGRAFLAAGSRSVVVTLWSVADEPTAVLMQDFYSLWLSGETKAEALRHAQIKLRQAFPSPAIWAPFILIGDPS